MDTNNQHACSIKQTPFINELLEHLFLMFDDQLL